jgi:hypothetical protein
MTYGDMPERGADMTCSAFGEAHGVYSATRGDYFWAASDDQVTCSECDAPMELGRMITNWVPVS